MMGISRARSILGLGLQKRILPPADAPRSRAAPDPEPSHCRSGVFIEQQGGGHHADTGHQQGGGQPGPPDSASQPPHRP